MAIKVRKGESADQAVERMFGAQGISLKDSGAFRINNKKVKEKLSQILNRLDEQPEGPMSSERNPRSGKPQSIVGKELSSELRNVFTRNDPRGTINVLINDITESIKNRIQLNFLYRSGKPSKYSDNELKGRVVSPVRFKITGLSKGSRSAASLKMDAIDEAYLRNNVEVLVKEGFAKDPNKLIEQAREVARQALDNEGKINPEGNFENELITAVFGQKESAPQIKDARLRELLAAKDSKLQHAYRSYDVDALAGIAPTGKSGIAFDWFNIKNNYSPFDDKLFMPTEPFEGSPGSYFRPKSSRDTSAQVRTFKSPVQLKDGSRLSGVADNPEQSPFYGFDKNGKEFSQGREYINPQDITKSRDSDRTANQIRNELESGQKLFIPAYHGTPHTLAPEAGAPLGRFRTSKIGTGEGAQAYGHGLYFAGRREVAEHYRNALGYDPDKMKINGRQINDEYNRFAGNPKATNLDYQIAEGIERLMMNESPQDVISYFKENNFDPKAIKYIKDAKFETYGSLYKVELAPKENEYLLWDKSLEDQPKGVQEKLKNLEFSVDMRFGPEKFKLSDMTGIVGKWASGLDSVGYSIEGGRVYKELAGMIDNLLGMERMPDRMYAETGQKLSAALKEAGIPGIKYLDGSSRSKGEGDFNYVIFDEADVTVTDKLFMPASEAGATKGKVAEAAKLWNEKGIDSPYFKKWFGKSKVVDENGEPLVVYHGTPEGGFSEFDLSKSGKSGDPGLRGKGFYFADSKYLAERYKDAPRNTKQEQAGQVYEVYLNIKNPYDAKANPLKVNFSKPEQSTKILKDKGFDGVIFKYGTGAKEIIAYSPEQIKSATGNRGTFDAGERNINYMPSDPKAPKAQPANRIQQQAPAMPGNRFMAPAASAGSKLSERFR